MGRNKQDQTRRSIAEAGDKTYWFRTEKVADSRNSVAVGGEVSRASLDWLIDLAHEELEDAALRRAAKSIRAFHETHIGAGTLGQVEPIDGRSGAAGADVEGLGIESRHRLEIVHDNQHGIDGFDGLLTYAVLWTYQDNGKTWEYISNLADLRGRLLD